MTKEAMLQAKSDAWERLKVEGEDHYEADQFDMFDAGWHARDAEIATLKDELAKADDTITLLMDRNSQLSKELAKYKNAEPVGIVRMSNPPDGNPKPIPKWILSTDQSHLKNGDLLFTHPDKETK